MLRGLRKPAAGPARTGGWPRSFALQPRASSRRNPAAAPETAPFISASIPRSSESRRRCRSQRLLIGSPRARLQELNCKSSIARAQLQEFNCKSSIARARVGPNLAQVSSSKRSSQYATRWPRPER
jgi:hypothetical protein